MKTFKVGDVVKSLHKYGNTLTIGSLYMVKKDLTYHISVSNDLGKDEIFPNDWFEYNIEYNRNITIDEILK